MSLCWNKFDLITYIKFCHLRTVFVGPSATRFFCIDSMSLFQWKHSFYIYFSGSSCLNCVSRILGIYQYILDIYQCIYICLYRVKFIQVYPSHEINQPWFIPSILIYTRYKSIHQYLIDNDLWGFLAIYIVVLSQQTIYEGKMSDIWTAYHGHWESINTYSIHIIFIYINIYQVRFR